MIIAGFAGTGKSFFCEKNESAIDFVCMPFKYVNYYEVVQSSGIKGETIKANDELVLREWWWDDYYWAIRDTQEKYPDQVIVIPTVYHILQELEEQDVPYMLVYPRKDAKDEYEKRYRDRGNTEEFIKIFTGRWEYWMEELRMYKKAKIVEMKKGEYLSDVINIPPFDQNRIIPNKENYIFERYLKNGML